MAGNNDKIQEIMICLQMIPGLDVSGVRFKYGGLLGMGSNIKQVEGANFIFYTHYGLLTGRLNALDGYGCKQRMKYAVSRSFSGGITHMARQI